MNFNAKEIVSHCLIKYPDLRDDDNRLMATIWSKQCGGTSAVANYSAFEFLKLFASGKLLSPESIRRTRQKLQEVNPELRGASYSARHEKEAEVREYVKKFKHLAK